MFIFDTETCGLTGPCVLIQWTDSLDGTIHLYHVWRHPVKETLNFIEKMCNEEIIGFNLAFDWFHINKLYTVLTLIDDKDQVPYDNLDAFIKEYVVKEERARFLDICVKPKTAHDIFLHAKKGPYQSLMGRKEIRIRKVPYILAYELQNALEEKIQLSDIYFARKADPTQRWTVLPTKDPQLADVALTFSPSTSLKALYNEIFDTGGKGAARFKDISLPKELFPKELGYAPYALALGSFDIAMSTGWPKVIKHHIDHYYHYEPAKQYAIDDVKYTRELYKHFGSQPCGDDDSILACMVGCCRWRGYHVDANELANRKQLAVEKLKQCPVTYNSTNEVRKYVTERMSDVEAQILEDATKGVLLENIAEWQESEVCNKCNGMGCDNCKEGLVSLGTPHPAAERAKIVLEARHAKKEIELYDKIIRAGHFHASFKVIGTLSSRMAGADGLNAQGIKNDTAIRSTFKLAGPGEVLCGGDFDAFEVNLMDASYGDPVLHQELVQGKKIHAVFGALFFDKTYEEIMATKNETGMEALYDRSKRGVFGLLYGGDAGTLARKINIDEDRGNAVYETMTNKYVVWAENRQRIFDDFCSMRQPNGIGSRVEWHEPAEYVESMFGFKRYFTLENQICKALFDLANDSPKEWSRYNVKIIRRDRIQTAAGATKTALFACAFAIQAANMRAAANHVIQSSGAEINKRLQVNIWELQPVGVHPWIVRPLNIHDEVMCPTKVGYEDQVFSKVEKTLDTYRESVPLIAIDWHSNMKNWAEK